MLQYLSWKMNKNEEENLASVTELQEWVERN